MDFPRLARKLTFTLFLAMSLGSAGFIVAATVNTIVGAEISGNPAWAGLPAAMFTLGTAVSAFLLGFAMERFGRRLGMVIGLVLGLFGTMMAAVAVGVISFPIFLAGMVFSGAARAALQLGRFAAAEVHPPEQRGRAISNVVIGGTVGAVLGPWLAGPMGQWALGAGYKEMIGPYVASFMLIALPRWWFSACCAPIRATWDGSWHESSQNQFRLKNRSALSLKSSASQRRQWRLLPWSSARR